MEIDNLIEFMKDPELNKAVQYLSSRSNKIINIEVLNEAFIKNVAVDPSADMLPPENNVMYAVAASRSDPDLSAGTGFPIVEFYNPLDAALKLSIAIANNVNAPITTLTSGGYYYTSRVRWNDNGATVGSYSIIIIGYKITYG